MNIKKFILIIFILVVCALSISITILIFFAYSGYQDLLSAKLKFSAGKISEAIKLSQNANTKFLIAKRSLFFLAPVLSIVPLNGQKDQVNNSLDAALEVSQGTKLMGDSVLVLSNILTSILSGKEYKKEDLTNASLHLSDAKNSLASAESQVGLIKRDVAKNIFLRIYNVNSIDEQLKRAILDLDIAKTIIDALPNIIPLDGEKNYLVLLQNNMELRPTGGFIGSFAILNFKSGRMSDLKLHDIYDADGQLKGHVEPPMPIRKYLPQVNWFLRDSNWDPDFQNSARKAAWFLEKEMGINVDGVIAVDINLAQLMLKQVGDVYLSDYKDTITSENLFGKASNYSEENFFPGSAGKKNFLGTLLRAIIDKINQAPDKNIFSTTLVLQKALNEKHLLFAFFDPAIQSVFTVNGWGGTLTSQNKESGLNDFLAVREANLGVNKVNFFVKREIKQTVGIQPDGSVIEEVDIIYNNQSPKASYKNYLRIYFPKQASITKLIIDGKDAQTIAAELNPLAYEKKGFWQNLGGMTEVEQTDDSGLSMIGFLVEIPSNSQKTVELTYQLKELAPLDKGLINYDLSISKQPGTETDPYFLTINYPSSFTTKTDNSSSIIQNNKLTIPSDLAQDREFTIQLLRKE